MTGRRTPEAAEDNIYLRTSTLLSDFGLAVMLEHNDSDTEPVGLEVGGGITWMPKPVALKLAQLLTEAAS